MKNVGGDMLFASELPLMLTAIFVCYVHVFGYFSSSLFSLCMEHNMMFLYQ